MDSMTPLLGKAGFLIFTGGLAIGAAIPKLRNPRMGLSAHLTAVQSGSAMIAIGLFWPHFGIPQWISRPMAWSLIGSTSTLLASLTLAAIFGAGQAFPIAGQGHGSSKAKEATVSLLAITSSVWMFLVCLVLSAHLLIG